MSGQLIAGRYRLQSVLGRGGMATVWRAVDERLGRPVAVKMLDRVDAAGPATAERFDREVHTAAQLSHPHIVAVHDGGRDGAVPFLVMELVTGHSLAARLARGPVPVGEAVRIARQVCDALAAAHAAGVVHRDIKPANILLADAGTVKVCDFGIARLTHQQATHLTAPQTVIGTSEYMAPEQAAGGPITARADLYALGCLLYAMLAGTPPFTGDNPLTVLWQHQHQPVPSVTDRRPDTPYHLQALIVALLAKNPADRPATADQVHDLLQPAPGDTTSTATPPPNPPGVTARAAVPVISRTRTLPEVHPVAATPPSGGRFRIGPAGIAAVAIGAAVLTALTAGLLLTANRPDTAAGPPGSPPSAAATAGPTAAGSTTAGSTTRAADRPADRIAAVRATIDEQARAGQLDAKTASELTDKLDQVERELANDKPDKAAEKLADLRKKLNDPYEENKITTAGYEAVLASLDQLAATLPAAETDEDDDG